MRRRSHTSSTLRLHPRPPVTRERHRVADHPSTTHAPSPARTGSATRTPSTARPTNSSDTHAVSPPSSAGLSTRSSTRNDSP